MNTRIACCGAAVVALLLAGCSEHQVLAPSSRGARTPLEHEVTGSGCQLVSGVATFRMFEFTSATTAQSTGVMTGDLVGTFAVHYFDLVQNGDGSGFLSSNHVLTTSTGTITTSDNIVLLPVDDPELFRPIAHMFITGGTGAYQGATGQLMVQGEYNHVTLAGSLTYQGQICVP
jgi:hypothetical protein